MECRLGDAVWGMDFELRGRFRGWRLGVRWVGVVMPRGSVGSVRVRFIRSSLFTF